jgi:hypothetical protein
MFIECTHFQFNYLSTCNLYALLCGRTFFLTGWAKAYSLTSFGRAAGFLSDLAMCVAVKRRHCDIINLVLTVYVGQLELFLGLALVHQGFFWVSVMV